MESITCIIDFDTYCAEMEKIEHFTDETEKNIRSKLMEEIWEKMTDFDLHVLEYEYEQHIKSLLARGVVFKPIKRSSIMAKWSNLFATSISNEDKKKIHYEQFKWHLFSFELLNARQSEDARQAFDHATKDTVFLFYQFEKDAFIIEHAHLLTAADFDVDGPMSKADIYVFDPISKWTYVRTHEDSCGPYFYQIVSL